MVYLSCDKCPKIFNTNVGLQNHRRSHLPNNTSWAKGKKFSAQHRMNMSIVHKNRKRYSRLPELNKEFFEEEYILKEKSAKEIGHNLALSDEAVYKRLKKFKIPRRSPSELNCSEKNASWKGDNVGYGALHDWVRYHKQKPEFCEECKVVKPYDLANISGEYKRDVNDFEWLCRKCHMTKDGRLERLKKVKKCT